MRVTPPLPLLPSPLAQQGGQALSSCLQLHGSCGHAVSVILLLLLHYLMLWGISCCLASSEQNAIAPSLAVYLSVCMLMDTQIFSHVNWPKYVCRVAGSGVVGRMPTGTFRAGSGAGASGGAALQRPVAPDLVANATSAAVAAASSAVDLSCMEIDVVAVGMGLRFVEIETNEKVCFLRAHGVLDCLFVVIKLKNALYAYAAVTRKLTLSCMQAILQAFQVSSVKQTHFAC